MISSIQQWLREVTGITDGAIQFTPISGGSINDSYRIRIGAAQFFCKINQVAKFPSLFEKEQKGLQLLAQQQVIRIPKVIAIGQVNSYQLLLLEWIEQGLKSSTFWSRFGEQLAALHHQQGRQFGLDTDNYMGSLPQYNTPAATWPQFFIEQRLRPQVALALQHHLLEPAQAAQFEQLYKQLPTIFAEEPPVLVHGDLWSGNFLCDEQEAPVLIDPAVYYGHRSVDLGLTTLFGGFDTVFYESYQYHYPLPVNYREQWEVCNVYPLLIHVNLFGKSYLADVLHTIRKY